MPCETMRLRAGAILLTSHGRRRQHRRMRNVTALEGWKVGRSARRPWLAALALSVLPTVQPSAQLLSPRDSALHALNRLAYGPRPGEADSVARLGVLNWIDQQLRPERLRDDRLTEREPAFK